MQHRFFMVTVSLSLFISGCNDARQSGNIDVFIGKKTSQNGGQEGSRGLIKQVTIRFNRKETSAQQMLIRGASMYLSGRPFGFSNWDVGSNPLSPRIQFAFSDNIQSFSPWGGWTPDYYASGAMGSLGQYVLTSGVAGASLIDMSNPSQAREVDRYPRRELTDLQVPQDPNFIYKAIIKHPTQNYFYGFREQDFVVKLKLTPNLVSIESTQNYTPNGQKGTCCVLGGATFMNQAFIAFRSSLRQYSFSANGELSPVAINNNLNPTNVVSTNDYLFVQHQAIQGNNLPSGVYIVTKKNASIFLPISPIAFAVSQDSNYIYANLDNDSVTVYQLNWARLTGGY
ncbi:MAG: hypothetical protein EXR74_07745 [Bdellovibrionales bacterium]|nr:hypothetical protein [Bdellovibrionales bacterium]